MKVLIINGPNLNLLGKRQSQTYGIKSLKEIDTILKEEAASIVVDIATFHSNSEGAIIDFIQKEASKADGIVINPGALTHYGLSLRDALVDTGIPVIEIHISNIYAREEWRHKSVIAPIAMGQISGLGWRGYIAALKTLVDILNEESQ